MPFSLSNDPIIRQQQLQQLIERSNYYLQLLTSPVTIDYPWAASPKVTSFNSHSDYVPPDSRFYHHTQSTVTLNFER